MHFQLPKKEQTIIGSIFGFDKNGPEYEGLLNFVKPSPKCKIFSTVILFGKDAHDVIIQLHVLKALMS